MTKIRSAMSLSNGFTLIEVIIYIALFGILIGGILTAAYQIIASDTTEQSDSTIIQDSAFIKAKIDWAVTGATNIYTTGSTLVISRPNIGTITFSEQDGNLTIRRNSDPALPLNSQALKVSGLNFIVTPAKITTTLTISQKTFTFTTYRQP